MVLGIDVGGTKIAAGLVDEAGRVVDYRKMRIDQVGPIAGIDQIVELLEAFETRNVGIGIPGIADKASNTVWAPNLKGWHHIDLLSEIRARVSNRQFVVESDRNTAVLAEVLFGLGKGRTDVLFLILGTGIGLGIFSGGRVLRGAHEVAGAIGWYPVWFRGTLETFESVAAGPGIVSRAGKIGIGGSLKEIVETARSGDSEAIRMFDEVGDVIGQVLSILVSTFNPELIVIGGGVSNAWDLLVQGARSQLTKWSQPVASKQVEICVSGLGDMAGIIGAAAAAYEFEKELL